MATKKKNKKRGTKPATSRLKLGQHSAYAEIASEIDRNRRAIRRSWNKAGDGVAATALSARSVTVVAEGDSWFDYPFNDVVDCLESQGYDIHSVARAGHVVEDMAHAQLHELVAKVGKHSPRFILLSGGGNDIAGPELAMLVNHRKSRLAASGEKLRPPVVQYVIHRVLRDAYRRIIETVALAADAAGIGRIDILGHGYAPPFADGRGAYWVFGPWLKPPLERRGYTDEAERNSLMTELIGEFNGMVAGLATEYSGLFHYINLQDRLPQRSDWANELHPSQQQFAAIARTFSDRMQEILSAP